MMKQVYSMRNKNIKDKFISNTQIRSINIYAIETDLFKPDPRDEIAERNIADNNLNRESPNRHPKNLSLNKKK